MNLDKLIDQFIGEEKELWQPKPFPKGKEGVLDNETVQIALQNAKEMTDNTWNHAYNQALQDLKSRKQELVEGIVGIINNQPETILDDPWYQHPDIIDKQDLIKELTGK